MDERLMQFRVGVMVLATLIITAVLILLFGEVPLLVQGTYEVTIRVPQAPGVTVDTPVRKSGVLIGRVTDVELVNDSGGGVLVRAAIQKDRVLLTGELPQVTGSLLGDATIEIVPGPSFAENQETVQPGSEIPGSVAPNPLEALTQFQTQLNDVFTELKERGRSLDLTVRDTAASVQRLTDQWTLAGDQANQSIEETAASIQRASDRLGLIGHRVLVFLEGDSAPPLEGDLPPVGIQAPETPSRRSPGALPQLTPLPEQTQPVRQQPGPPRGTRTDSDANRPRVETPGPGRPDNPGFLEPNRTPPQPPQFLPPQFAPEEPVSPQASQPVPPQAPEAPAPDFPSPVVPSPEVPGSDVPGSDVPGSDVPGPQVPTPRDRSPEFQTPGFPGPGFQQPSLLGPQRPGADRQAWFPSGKTPRVRFHMVSHRQVMPHSLSRPPERVALRQPAAGQPGRNQPVPPDQVLPLPNRRNPGALRQTQETLETMNRAFQNLDEGVTELRRLLANRTLRIAINRISTELPPAIQEARETLAQTREAVKTGRETLLKSQQAIEGVRQDVRTSLQTVNQDIKQSLDSVADKANQSLETLTKEGQTSLRILTTDARETVTDARGAIADAREALTVFKRVGSSAERNLQNLEPLTEGIQDDATRVLERINGAATKLDVILGEAQMLVKNLNDGEGTLGQLLTNPQIYNNANAIVRNVNTLLVDYGPRILEDVRVIVDKIARDPGRVVGGLLRRDSPIK